MTLFEDYVAAKVISAFNCFPGNGKPKEDGTSISEFTVLAAIVAKTGTAISDDEAGFNLTVVSMATGTKCAGKGREDKFGYTTSDSHAEVLARRGFVRWLSKCMAALQNCPNLSSDPAFPLYDTDPSTVANGSGNLFTVAPYAVKDNWYFYLYISDSPCGDGTLYSRTIEDCQVVGYTGAKLIRPDTISSTLDPTILMHESHRTANRTDSDNVVSSGRFTAGRSEMGHCSWEREHIQDLGVVRTKSGRSDIKLHNRTSSMSCSDKICRYRLFLYKLYKFDYLLSVASE